MPVLAFRWFGGRHHAKAVSSGGCSPVTASVKLATNTLRRLRGQHSTVEEPPRGTRRDIDHGQCDCARYLPDVPLGYVRLRLL